MDDQGASLLRENAPVDRELLVEQYGWVSTVARSLVRDPWGAEDVTQETLLAALSAAPRDSSDAAHLRAWLGRVAFNLSRLVARQGSRRRAREERVARKETLPSASELVEAQARVVELAAAIAELPEAQRQVIELRYLDGLTMEEVARRTSSSTLAVRKRLWRARGRLRELLDRNDPRGGALAAWLPWGWLRRDSISPQGALAAGAVLAAGAATWFLRLPAQGADRREPELAGLALDPGAGRPRAPELAGAGLDGDVAQDPASEGHTSRRPWIFGLEERPLSDSGERVVERAPFQGAVLDLEGRGRPGLSVVDAASPAHPLAVSDAAGAFRARPRELPATLRATGDGWASVCEARVDAGQETWPQALIVAPAIDLRGRVCDEAGRPLDARLEVVCDETAWALLDRAVRLPSEVLASLAVGESGTFAWRAVPTGAGLSLRVAREGYSSLERATTELVECETFVLRSLAGEPFVEGLVRRPDGRPGSGALVRLALASTRADEDGRFRLQLRSVRPDSSLEAWHEDYAPTRIERFGERVLRMDRRSIDIVLGDEHDTVRGEVDVAGARSARAGWRLVARATEEGTDALATAGESWSDADGEFRFRLPHGSYSLLALSPDGLCWAPGRELGTEAGLWRLQPPAPGELRSVAGRMTTPEGTPLGGARLLVACRPARAAGVDLLAWRELSADLEGRFAFEIDARAHYELRVTHPAVGSRWVGGAGEAGPGADLVVPGAAFLRVAGEDGDACALLDEEGAILVARGPLGEVRRVPLRAGASPVLEISSATRWVQLLRGGEELARIPIRPADGRILSTR